MIYELSKDIRPAPISCKNCGLWKGYHNGEYDSSQFHRIKDGYDYSLVYCPGYVEEK